MLHFPVNPPSGGYRIMIGRGIPKDAYAYESQYFFYLL